MKRILIALPALFLACGAQDRPAQILEFSDPPRAGGWSGLARDPLDSTGRTLWAVSDQNPPLLLKFRLDGSRLEALSVESLATPDVAGDFEGLRLTRTHGILCEESGPSLVEFDRPTRHVTRRWSPGSGLPEVLANRRPNHGFEGIAITPSGKFVGLLQSPLWNWVGKRKQAQDTRILRMVELDPRTGTVREFALLPEGHRQGDKVKMGDLVALDDTRFLAIEHNKEKDGSISADLVLLDLAKATDISSSGPHGKLFAQGKKTLEELMDAAGLAKEAITPVQKSMVRENFVVKAKWPVDKPEGLEVLHDSTVILLNDNDFGRKGARSSLLILPIPSLH